MSFAAAAGPHSGRATPSLREAPQQQPMSTTGRGSTYRRRNAVQTNPATSLPSARDLIRVWLDGLHYSMQAALYWLLMLPAVNLIFDGITIWLALRMFRLLSRVGTLL